MSQCVITSLTKTSLFLPIRKERINNGIFNWKRERLNNPIVLFNDKFFPMSKNSSNNILTFKSFSDKVGESIDFDSGIGVNFSNIGYSPSRNRQFKSPFRINICSDTKSFRDVSEGSPEIVSEYPRKSCIVFFLDKSSVRFLIIIVIKKAYVDSPQGINGRTIMPSKHSILPESIKAFNRGISPWLSLRDENQMNPEEKMKPNNLGYAVFISPSACSRHLVVHLRYFRNSHKLPCINKMPAKRKGLLTIELTCKSSMPCHINSVEGIKACNSFWTSEISRANEVCLVEISHILCLEIWIRLIIAISFGLSFGCFPITREYIGNSRDRGNIFNLSLVEFPVDDFCSNSRESGAASFVIHQFLSDGEYLFDKAIRSLSPNSLWGTALIPESFKSMLFISIDPFRKPNPASFKQLEYFVKANSFFIKLYCLTAFFIFMLMLHCLSLPPKLFGRSLGNA